MIYLILKGVKSDPLILDLGYLSGGARAMARFAASPGSVLTVYKDGISIWDTEPFQEIHSMDDFAAVILLSENPDTSRDWIEQAGRYLTDTPLLLIISIGIIVT